MRMANDSDESARRGKRSIGRKTRRGYYLPSLPFGQPEAGESKEHGQARGNQVWIKSGSSPSIDWGKITFMVA